MWDVAIIGGGPAGSTCGSILKRYAPGKRVLILEREKFPREHVGESQLPPINQILVEMGVWDKIEAANFPIKVGATYRWGNTNDLWDFELFPASEFRDEPRPAKFEGQRTKTAFQVDRAVYDQILLDHAKELGCEVREETRVVEVLHSGDRVDGLRLDGGEIVEARHYVDASGGSGIIRRTMGVELDEPGGLKNIAIWDYWQNAEWAISIGVGGTRVQVMSLGYGWLWFIPIGPTRSSLGLVVPAEYYKKSGMKPKEIYEKAIREDPLVRSLIENATPEGQMRTTKDWNFVAKRMSGENWMLAGESAGFADPILAAGMTLAHAGAREAAYTILALDRGSHPAEWLKEQYRENQASRIYQHIRFANFWYHANGCFTDLKAYTSEIARDAGLELDPNEAFQWLGTGGFVFEKVFNGLAGFPLGAVKDIVELFLQKEASLKSAEFNYFTMNLEGAQREKYALYGNGRVEAQERLVRDGKTLPFSGMYYVLAQIISQNGGIDYIVGAMVHAILERGVAKDPDAAMEFGMPYLESMVRDGWVTGEYIEGGPTLEYDLPRFASSIHVNRDMPVPSA
jgi:flavin-dependent dehydrogenase